VRPDYKIPYTLNSAVGFTQQFGRALTMRLDYVHTHTRREHRA
jgi:hypothetical protein